VVGEHFPFRLEVAKNLWLFASRNVQEAPNLVLSFIVYTSTSILSGGRTTLIVDPSIRQQKSVLLGQERITAFKQERISAFPDPVRGGALCSFPPYGLL